MFKWYWYMGFKQLKYYGKQTAIGVGGIAATVVVLMVILSFGQGIQEFLTERILLLTPHLSLEAGYNDFILEDWQDSLENFSGISGSSPYLVFPGVVQRGLVNESVAFKGIDWDLEDKLFDLQSLLDEGDWSTIRERNGLVLGGELALRLGVDLGDNITIITAYGARNLELEGVFYTGYYPLDSNLVLLPLEESKDLLETSGISGYSVKIDNFPHIDQYILPLQDLTGLWIRPWYDKEQSMFITMSVQRIVLIWIMIFSLLISALGIMNIFLLRSWGQRRNVGVFRTLGATPGQIGALLLTQGVYSGIMGGVVGIVVARLIVFILSKTNIRLPQVFYLERLPISWAKGDLWWVVLLAFATGLCAVIWPARRMTKLEVGKVLRDV